MKLVVVLLGLIVGGMSMTAEAKSANESPELLAIALIAKHEGFRDKTYICPGGHLTIGYGFSDSDIVRNGTITRTEADKILGRYVRMYLCRLNRELPWLSVRQQAGLVSLIYNIGAGAFYSSTLFSYLQKKDIPNALVEIKRWNHVGKKAVDGLTKRRAEEAEYLKR